MARKPKGETKQQPAAKTAESFSDDALQALFFQHKKTYEQRLAAKKKADADFKNSCKLAKAELGKGAVDDIKAAIDMETEEGEARIKARLEGTLRVARWVGASLGTQFEMFDGDDKTPAADRAHGEGKRAGLKGEPASPPYHPSTEQHRKWMEGYHDGQSALATKGIKPLSGGDEEDDVRPRFVQSDKGRLGTAPATHTVS